MGGVKRGRAVRRVIDMRKIYVLSSPVCIQYYAGIADRFC